MTSRRRLLLRTIPFFVVGILVFLLYLFLFVNIHEMMEKIQNANMLIYALATFMVILEVLLFTLAWQHLLFPLSVKISLKKAFAYVWISIFADLLIPAESVSGEVARTYLMAKEPNVNTGKVVASLVGQRMLGTATTIVALFVGFVTLLALKYPVSGFVLQIFLTIIVASAIAFAFLVIICIKEEWTERLVNAVMHFVERVSRGRFQVEHFQTKIIKAVRAFYKSLKTFGSKPTTLILPATFSVLSWLSSVTIVFAVFVSIGYLEPNIPILLLKLTIVHTLIISVQSIPLGVPGEVGLPDIIMTTLFILFAIPADVSAAATILTRILTVWLRFFIGFVAVQWLGVKNLMESGVFDQAANKI